MLLTSPGPERVQTMGCGRAECLGGLTFSSCDPHKSHKSNVTRFLRYVPAEHQEDVLCPQSSMKAEQIQNPAYLQPIHCSSHGRVNSPRLVDTPRLLACQQ